MHKFGRWQFEASTGDLYEGETSIRLEPQVAKLLEYFLDHQNTLTSRDELIASVWENRSVSDDAINRCISILRSHLTPEDKNAYIETVIRRGFIGHFPDAPNAPADAGATARHRKQRITILLAMLVGAAAVLLFQLLEKHPGSSSEALEKQREYPPIVAVLPFAIFGEAGDTEFFANGMHDDLLTRMAQLQSIRVISRTSVLEYQGIEQNIRAIGKVLGADAILEGSIQRLGEQIRINVQLIDTRSDEHLWAKSYDRQLSPENIFDVQAEIAQSIVVALKTALTAQDATQLKVLPTENMAAYRAYHRAMEIRDSIGLDDPAYLAALEEAVKLDPTFVRALAELAGFLSLENFSQQDPDIIQQTERVLEQIQTLAPQSAELLIAQSYYSYYILKNYDAAYELVKLAQNMRPSDERVLELKAHIERRMGKFGARIESIRLAKKLDPRNPHWTQTLVINLMITHQYELAAQEIARSDFQNMILSELQSMLDLRNGWEPQAWIESLAQLQIEYGVNASPSSLWDSRIAARDYVAADELLIAMQEQLQQESFWVPLYPFNILLSDLITLQFLAADDRLSQLLPLARTQLDEQLNSNAQFDRSSQYLIMAFMYAAEGNTEEAKRAIRMWDRSIISDIAGLSVLHHYACRALGMAAATHEAVECIRKGLAEPSFIMPFMEPNLPYYDSIRDTPEFIELVADIRTMGSEFWGQSKGTE